ncbi:MAG: PAS domain S-box protein [Victivallaceae bacterium]|nr:PAS domain S-box protein [Victivallaceae bacterium]
MFYFHETFEYFLNHEPLTFMDAFINHVPKYSLFIRLIYVVMTLMAGAAIGLLLERDHKKNTTLLAKERDYREAVQAVNEGIFTYLADSDKISASPLCYSMLGYVPGEVGNTREAFFQLISPEQCREFRKSLAAHIAKGKSFSFELKMATKNGNWKWILLKGNVQEINPDGSARRIVGIVADITKQVETRKQLANYTACLEEAEQVAHVGHWEFDYKSQKISWAREIFNILQLPFSPEIRSDPRIIVNLVHPEDRRRTRLLFLNSIRKHSNFDCTYRIVLNDGSIKYISQRGHHVFDKSGQVVRSFGTIQDITQSSLATQALANSEKRYRTLFENVYQGIIIADQETGQLKLANKVFCDMFGYQPEEVLGCQIKDLHPEVNFRELSAWARAGEKTFSGNTDCRRRDGSVFPAEIYASSITLDKCLCVIGIFRDLTETYQVEYERHMLKVAVDNSDVEIVIINSDGTFDYCSPAICRRLGYNFEEIRKMQVWDIESTVNEEDVPGLWKELKAKKVLRGEGIETAKDGTKFEINYVADYVKIGNRELICCQVQDVTERKQREAILENARKKAEESDRLKSIFLANISHGIRTPMNGILGFADLLQNPELLPEKRRQYAKIISECGSNLMHLLNDMLDISRIEAGGVEIKKANFCVNEVIEELYDFYEPQTRQKGQNLLLQMHKSLRDDEAVVCSDERYFRQILTNLLNNALKFTEKGEILMGYNAKRNGIEFFVKDSGSGIAPELLDKIFEPFRQGEEALARKYHGSGLGLAIAKNYAELLGGYMWVESEVGQGSTFYFTLPYSKNIGVRTDIAAPPVIPDYNWKDKKFLIAEDNHVTFMLFENLLENTGAKIYRAETAQQSVDLVKQLPDLDLVLMDVRLPDFTGWEAAKLIKKYRPDLPVAIQTANATVEDKIKTFQAGCEAYLTKPIIKKEFYGTLAKLLRK